MHLHREDTASGDGGASTGVEVLVLSGPVTTSDAAGLQAALRTAVARPVRGVVLDLTDAGPLSAEAVDVLNWAAREATGWPRPGLAVCCAPADLLDLLVPEVCVHTDRAEAVAHVDDRPEAPLCVRTEVPADAQAPRLVRRLAEQCAQDNGFDGDDLGLVVSELVTNAVRHGAPPVEVEIGCCEHCVTVVVSDAGATSPAARPAEPEDEGGRGMLLVDLLAAENGVRPTPSGKSVWAELPLRPR